MEKNCFPLNVFYILLSCFLKKLYFLYWLANALILALILSESPYFSLTLVILQNRLRNSK